MSVTSLDLVSTRRATSGRPLGVSSYGVRSFLNMSSVTTAVGQSARRDDAVCDELVGIDRRERRLVAVPVREVHVAPLLVEEEVDELVREPGVRGASWGWRAGRCRSSFLSRDANSRAHLPRSLRQVPLRADDVSRPRLGDREVACGELRVDAVDREARLLSLIVSRIASFAASIDRGVRGVRIQTPVAEQHDRDRVAVRVVVGDRAL